MLYNIMTGKGVPCCPQDDIIYLCCKMMDIVNGDFQWCYTDGNAAVKITKFYNNIDNIEGNLDWRSINSTDFRTLNADGDEDRIRKKHAEFLVRRHVPVNFIKAIVVYSDKRKEHVSELLQNLEIEINVFVKKSFYF